jgi:DNA-directed RNA polymerase subunit RPC12/RpoP
MLDLSPVMNCQKCGYHRVRTRNTYKAKEVEGKPGWYRRMRIHKCPRCGSRYPSQQIYKV